MVGTLQDITERKEAEESLRASEELYRSLVEAAGNAVVRINRRGKHTFIGGDALNTGHAMPEDFHKGKFASYLESEDKKRAWALLRQTFRTGKPVRGFVSRWRDNRGIRHTSYNWEPIRDADGNIVEVQSTSIDITGQVEAERRRMDAERLEALATMAGGIAHDVNNILAMVTLWANIAQKKAGTPGGEEAMRNILKATRDGTETMQRLQRFSSPASRTEKQKVDLTAIAAECLEFTRPMWKDAAEVKDQYIRVIENPGEVADVSGNNPELREVVINLITNAIEAMPSGGTLTVSTFQRGDNACISVSDTGAGMSEEITSQIFDPYFTTKGREGSGLGLSTAKGITTAHGGEMTVRSEPEAGSTFTISLPSSVTGEKRKGHRAKSRLIEQTSGGPRYDVLVVDDEPLVRAAMEAVLQQEGYRAVAAKDGPAALKLFGEGEFDIVLLDVGMPKMNGFRVAEQMRKLHPDVAIILVTGWGDEVDQEQVKATGVDAVINKPFEPLDMLQRVNEVMERRRNA
jgi:PAS domain S-box-containing protein